MRLSSNTRASRSGQAWALRPQMFPTDSIVSPVPSVLPCIPAGSRILLVPTTFWIIILHQRFAILLIVPRRQTQLLLVHFFRIRTAKDPTHVHHAPTANH